MRSVRALGFRLPQQGGSFSKPDLRPRSCRFANDEVAVPGATKKPAASFAGGGLSCLVLLLPRWLVEVHQDAGITLRRARVLPLCSRTQRILPNGGSISGGRQSCA